MLNGKFYTGLPPGMMERTGGNNRNRQESHIFWPDDTEKETVVEARVKRRTSLQLEPTERPVPPLQRQVSLGSNSGDEVDTRQMFHKEFTKSSIHFCDDIQEEEGALGAQMRRPRVRPGKFMKQGITAKPTATKLTLPDHTADEEYTNQKKQQLLSSTIKFYDYEMEEEMNQRNNVRKPKMDMNDKKEVERNNKNSPKLQLKKNVSEGFKKEREECDYKPLHNGGNSRDAVEERRPKRERSGPIYGTSRIETEKVNTLKSNWEQRAHNDGQDHYERESSRYARSAQLNGRKQQEYKDYKSSHNEHDDYIDKQADTHYLEDSVRHMHISKSPPQRHVHYEDENYAEEIQTSAKSHNPNGRNRSTEITYNSRSAQSSNSPRLSPPNMRAGSNNHQVYQKRQHSEYPNTPDFNYNDRDDEYQYMETSRNNNNQQHHYYNSSNNKTPTPHTYSLFNNNTYNNNSNKKLNNSPNQQQQNQKFPKPAKNYSLATAASAAETYLESPSSPPPPPVDAQKHLRSNLCFHDGAIVASAAPPTSGNQQHQQRRNARSLADTQRVSVGLPD